MQPSTGTRSARASWLRFGLLCLALLLPLLLRANTGLASGNHKSKPRPTAVRKVAPAGALAQVRAIRRGLSVQPPRRRAGRGRVKQRLFNRYALRTAARQKAEIGFKDGTVLHMNQRTDAVLQSPTVTLVRAGEVAQQVVPGSRHRVQTGVATASAIGTKFDVRVRGKITVVTVAEGAVVVANKFGRVIVKTNRRTTVRPGRKPSRPVKVNAVPVIAWINDLPPPPSPIGENAALDANGGRIAAADSTLQSPTGTWGPARAIDGDLQTSWHTAAGATTNQRLFINLGGHTYRIIRFLLDCAATGGQPAADAAARFQIAVSTGSSPSATFTPVVTKSCLARNQLQRFDLKLPISGRLVRLTLVTNHGGREGISVAEFEVITTDPLILPGSQPGPVTTPPGAAATRPAVTATAGARATATAASRVTATAAARATAAAAAGITATVAAQETATGGVAATFTAVAVATLTATNAQGGTPTSTPVATPTGQAPTPTGGSPTAIGAGPTPTPTDCLQPACFTR